jgi:hypothetical protein
LQEDHPSGGFGSNVSRLTFPSTVVEHVSNVLESLEKRHVENVPGVRIGLLSESSRVEFGRRRL